MRLDHLGAQGWLDEEGGAAAYSRELALCQATAFGPVSAGSDRLGAGGPARCVGGAATRAVRQVRYPTHNENRIDLALFPNGIPVSTVELKTDNTQNIDNAASRYKTDRRPKAAGQGPEPLLCLPSGALVHFALSNRDVRITTSLEGPRIQFLPFDQGSDPGGPDRGAGNPVMEGHHTFSPIPASRATSARPSRAPTTRSRWWPTNFRPVSTSRRSAART